MSLDRRESVLLRLVTVCRGVTGIERAVRNETTISGRHRPAIAVLDGDEEADPHSWDRGRPSSAPNMVIMHPEVYIMASRAVADQLVPDDDPLGPLLSVLRGRVLRAVLFDSELSALVTPNGDIRYEGCTTDLARGRTMEGEMVLNIGFKYPFKPTDL